LNALLAAERRRSRGRPGDQCPLISAFGASNEVPADESLSALFDRFAAIRSDNLDAY
jgi:MoxR-like ATPase